MEICPVIYMEYGVILNIRVISDHCRPGFRPDDGVEPNAGIVSDGNIAPHNSPLCKINIFSQYGSLDCVHTIFLSLNVSGGRINDLSAADGIRLTAC